MTFIHAPVLIGEAMEFLKLKEQGLWVDATLGMGGHSEAILQKIGSGSALIGIDCDAESIGYAEERLKAYNNFKAVKANFRHIDEVLARLNVKEISGVLYDLGVSSLHLDKGERGFSFSKDAPLDMRMDKSKELTAFFVVNNYKRSDLERIILKYGEERNYKRITDAIIKSRPVKSTMELAEIIGKSKNYREKINPATKTFQAIRIEVNDELNALSESLNKVHGFIVTGGRMVVISFHSLEDRIAKRFFSTETRDCICTDKKGPCNCGHKKTLKVLTKKPVTASGSEITENPRARSAKLRAAEKIEVGF